MRKIVITILAVILFLVLIIYFMERLSSPNKNQIFGVTFSPIYAEYLDLDYKEVYQKTINELGFKYVRLMAQWDEIEEVKGQYDFTRLDWLMRESEKNNVKVILALGRKTPRWPECHLPTWSKEKEYKEYRPDLLKYMETVVKRYKDNKALEIWQVENEPFLAFGACKNLPREDLVNEINLVRRLDNKSHKIIITDSGELSIWRKTIKAGDLFGTTIYRVVWSEWIGYFSYDWLPSFFYKAKLKIFNRNIQDAYIVELQAEPWLSDRSVQNTKLKEQFKSMSLDRLKKSIIFSQKTTMPRSYLWGVEWWYWLAENNNKTFLDYIKNLKKQ